jgi:hypothetical protein
MTNEPLPSAAMARQVLSSTDRLTRRVRQAQRGTWFPLVLLGLVVIAAAPFYRLGRHTVTCDPVLGARGGVEIIDRGACVQVANGPSGAYWILAFVVAYAAIAAFYMVRARSRGVGSRVLPYVGSGVVVGLVFGVASAWAQRLHLYGYSPGGPIAVGMAPLLAIALALFVLARMERSWAVLAFAVGYLLVALLANGGGGLGRGSASGIPATWGFLPGLLIAGGVLLLGGAAFALAERRRA